MERHLAHLERRQAGVRLSGHGQREQREQEESAHAGSEALRTRASPTRPQALPSRNAYDRPAAAPGRPAARCYSRGVDARIARALCSLLAAAAAAVLLALPAGAAETTPQVLLVEFDNDVNPVTQSYLQDELERGEREGFDAVVVELDTPGGLGSSMREIVKSMLAAKVPVVVYVAPSGSSADSAGAVIGEAADVLAMAPQTNIGSSTPISATGEELGEDLRRKVINDAAAYIAELAREHGRNAEAAEAMVREAANYGAREALKLDVIDVIAPSVPALLEQIDGRRTVPKGFVLDTAGADVERVEMSLWKRALDLLIDPNVIALMLSLGLLGIVVELWNPGLIFPGTVGAISLVVGLYGLQVLPVSAAGLLLMLLAAGFFVAEAFVVEPRRARARRGGHVRDRRADPVRPGRRGVPGLALDRRRDRRHARAPARGRAQPRRARRGATPSRSAWASSSATRASCAATAGSSSAVSSGGRGPPAERRSSPASTSPSRRSRTT